MTTHQHLSPAASFDAATPAVHIHDLTVTDPATVAEARRWSTGARGPACDAAEMVGADLTGFVTHALRVGASAIAAAGNAQDTFDLERLVTEVGSRATVSSAEAADRTGKAVADAVRLITDASEQAKRTFSDAESSTRKSFAESVATAKTDLQTEVTRLFGGTKPDVLERLRPLLERFGTELDAKVSKQTGELLAKAAQQFDPSDPTSPMAKHARELAAQQKSLTETLAKNHEALAGKVEALTTAMTVQAAAREAAEKTASVTPLKGSSYADGVHRHLEQIAVGLGDDYADTGSAIGAIARSKKGDGVLSVSDCDAKVVVEMTDSVRRGWHDYLDEAERNREAAASLGLVRTLAQNAGESIRVLGSRRIVMAFDPATDGPNLLRTVIMLLRTASIAATSRRGADEIATAEDKITDAIALLAKIDGIQKTAGTIRKSADKIDTEAASFSTAIQRLLSQALDALAGADAEATSDDALATGAA